MGAVRALTTHAAAHASTCWPDTSFPLLANSSPRVGDVAERSLVPRPGRMIAARDGAPLCRIDRRKVRVALRPRVHMGDLHAVGKGHASARKCRCRRSRRSRPRRAAARRHAPPPAPRRDCGATTTPGAAQSSRSRLTTMLVRPGSGLPIDTIGLAAHHHRLAHGERLEALEVGALAERQRIVAPDHAVVGDGGEEDDGDAARRLAPRSHRHLRP